MENQIPLGPDGRPKKRFEVKTDGHRRAIFVDGQLFDWSIDPQSLAEATRMGPEYLKAAKADIQKHFLECMSEIAGRQVTARDIARATKEGWI
jgi:hypothetical protein